MVQDPIPTFERTGLIGADSNDPFAYGFIVEERIELDNAVNIRKRHMQRSGDLRRDRFGKPAINSLGRMQCRQKSRAAHRNVRSNCRGERCKVNFGHGFSERDTFWKKV
jgi:hypothetical protein